MDETTSTGIKPWDWMEMHPEEGGGFALPDYCVQTGYLNEHELYVGLVKGHIGLTPIEAPAKIAYGGSNETDKITYTFNSREYDAFQPPVEADVYALVGTLETLKRVKKNLIDTKFKHAVVVNSDNDPQCRAKDQTFISRNFRWVSPKELKSPKKSGVYEPFEAGKQNAGDVTYEKLYVGRTSSYTPTPHIPGKVVLEVSGKNGEGRPGKIWYGIGGKEYEYQDEDPEPGKPYQPKYEILVLVLRKRSLRCSIL